jgi:hypothetical protein
MAFIEISKPIRRDTRSLRPRVASVANRDRADANARRIAPHVASLQAQGILTGAELARSLNNLDIRTASGMLWTSTQTARLLRRLEAMTSSGSES